MKVTAKQFALGLYESVDGKTPAQVKAVIKKFVELLSEKHRLGGAEKIIAEFIKIWNVRQGIVEARAASAKPLDKETVKLLKKYLSELAGAKEVILSETLDEGLLGGVVLRYGDKVLDGSLKTDLAELKTQLIK